ncbi:MAG: hypothetical protein ACOYXW_07920 [Actinomycetota bacterium]
MSATRTAVSAFGLLVALAGAEHGLGELVQGGRADGLVIESWPDAASFEALSGEPAMTVVPDLTVSGVLTILVSVALGVWAVGFAGRRYGGLVLVGLSVLLLLVGGGFAPPVMGVVTGLVATRTGHVGHRPARGASWALARLWPWVLGAAVAGFLALVPGIVVVDGLTTTDVTGVVAAVTLFAVLAFALALAAARARDRVTGTRVAGGG